MRCDICNSNLKDYEYLFGESVCNICQTIINQCLYEPNRDLSTPAFEDLEEGITETYNLDYYDNLGEEDEENDPFY